MEEVKTKESEKVNMDTEIVENNKELAIASLSISLISLFILPILGILGIILGSIVIGTNENTESWNTPVWKYKNKSLGYGRLALIWGIIDVVYIFIQIME